MPLPERAVNRLFQREFLTRARVAPCQAGGADDTVYPGGCLGSETRLRGREGMSTHTRSPNLAWRIARTAGPAVSVRRTRGPRPTTMKPPARAASTSARLRPPPGPPSTVARAPAGREAGGEAGG